MTSICRFAGPVLFSAAFSSGCGGYGSSASVDMGQGPTPELGGGGGITTGSAGGTGNAAGGTTGTSAAGGTTGAGADGGTISANGGTSNGGTANGGTGATSQGGIGATGGTSNGGNSATGGTMNANGGTAGMSTPSAWGTPVAGGPMGTGVTATVTVSPGTTVGTIGPGFAGFSFEKTHVTNGSLTSTNAKLIALYKLLGSPVTRIGANDVDVSNWAGMAPAPAQPSGQPFTHNITSGGVDQLCSFLAATGTKVIYAVNFKSANVTASAAEAAYVEGKCGSSVYGFEIGNEIDKYGSWGAQQTEWESFATAIVATPGALLIGPATTGGGATSLAVPFAKSESAKFGSKLVLLTQHYYAGSSGSTSATAATLQTVKADVAGIATTMNGAASADKVPDGFRMGECNTFSGHGQQGVSDTLISGLWAIDFMFVNAEHGASGVNFHGGETGMDGTKPFYYEPIMENNGAVVQVQPEYYGMLLMKLAGTGSVVSTTVSSSNANLTAYAIKADGFTSVVLDNKNAANGVNATINLGAPVASASAIYLQGTPLGSLSAPATAVTLAGAPVTTAGVWNRGAPYIQTATGNTVSVYVPPASAALVHIPQ